MTTPAAASEISRRRRIGAWAVVFGGTVLGTLDSSIVNVSYPSMAQDLGVRMDQVVWAGITYSLALGPLALAMGRLADRFGIRRLYVLGFLLFGLSSLWCGLSGDLTTLCVARAVQGAGFSMVMGNGMALLAQIFPPRQLGRALGSMPLAVGIGISTGPVAGGFLTQHLGWPWIFFATVPFGLGLALAAGLLLPARTGGEPRGPFRFDWAGLATSAVAVVALVLALHRVGSVGGLEGESAALLGAAAVAGGAFLWIERRAAQPLVPLAFVLQRRFLCATLAGVLSLVLIFHVVTLMPFLMERMYRFKPALSGQVLLVNPVCLSLMGPVSGWITDRFGKRLALSLVGLGLGGLSAGLLAFAPQDAGPVDLIWRLGFLGVGMGFFQTPNNTMLMHEPPKALVRTVSCYLTSIRTLGWTLGMALGGVSVPLFYGMHTGEKLVSLEALAPGPAGFAAFRQAFLLGIGIAVLALGCVLASRGARGSAGISSPE